MITVGSLVRVVNTADSDVNWMGTIGTVVKINNTSSGPIARIRVEKKHHHIIIGFYIHRFEEICQ